MKTKDMFRKFLKIFRDDILFLYNDIQHINHTGEVPGKRRNADYWFLTDEERIIHRIPPSVSGTRDIECTYVIKMHGVCVHCLKGTNIAFADPRNAAKLAHDITVLFVHYRKQQGICLKLKKNKKRNTIHFHRYVSRRRTTVPPLLVKRETKLDIAKSIHGYWFLTDEQRIEHRIPLCVSGGYGDTPLFHVNMYGVRLRTSFNDPRDAATYARNIERGYKRYLKCRNLR